MANETINPKWRRGLRGSLDSTPIEDGNILVTTDTNELFLDIDGKRLPISVNNIVQCTQAEYDALPDTKLSDNILYLIDDDESAQSDDIPIPAASPRTNNTGYCASDIAYDNSISGLKATNLQDAIDEVLAMIKNINVQE